MRTCTSQVRVCPDSSNACTGIDRITT